MVLLVAAGGASAQTGAPRSLPGSVTIGPRMVDYRVECTESGNCRVQCFQNGVQVIDVDRIGARDSVRLFASSSVNDELVPRWIEIRPAGKQAARTIMLSADTSCDLHSLVIKPNLRP